MDEVAATSWDALVKARSPKGSDNPFILHAFLSALEDSGSATAKTGWLPQHLALEGPAAALLGALPCYLKTHSQGEYVFDHGWADAYRARRRALLSQAAGRRAVHAGHRAAAARRPRPTRAAARDCSRRADRRCNERHGASSVHITFLPEDEWKLAGRGRVPAAHGPAVPLAERGLRHLRRFPRARSPRASARRSARSGATALRERHRHRAAHRHGLTEEHLGRASSTSTWTPDRANGGGPTSRARFFSLIGERMAERILLIMARRGGRYIAGAINFIGADCLYGRHWGCVEDHPFLHFELCYYQAIDYAIAHGLARVEAGAQGEHKLARGYLPVTTRSAHHIAASGLRRAVADYLAQERKRCGNGKRSAAGACPVPRMPDLTRAGRRTDSERIRSGQHLREDPAGRNSLPQALRGRRCAGLHGRDAASGRPLARGAEEAVTQPSRRRSVGARPADGRHAEDGAGGEQGLRRRRHRRDAVQRSGCAGRSVFHLHFHVIPRHAGVPLRPHSGQMEKPEILAANAEKIRAALASL